MRHSENNLANTMFNKFIEGNLKTGNERFTTLNTKALGSVEFICKELLELISPN
jgi:hypothetical protein